VAEHPFLSPEWITAARALRAEYADRLPEPLVAARLNVVITGVPHGDTDVMEGHIDTTEGQTIIEYGHLDDPNLTVTVDYDTAKAAFVTRDQEALMQAFFGGKILVEGDVSKLLALQATPPESLEAVRAKMLSLTRDKSPEVQLQVAVACTKLEGVDPLPVLVDLLAYSGDDPLIPHIVWQNLHPLLEDRSTEFLTLVKKHDLSTAPNLKKILPRATQRIIAAKK